MCRFKKKNFNFLDRFLKQNQIKKFTKIHSFGYENSMRADGQTNRLGEVNPLTPELNPSAQRCLTQLFIGDFAS
jgi:hypothetical protein